MPCMFYPFVWFMVYNFFLLLIFAAAEGSFTSNVLLQKLCYSNTIWIGINISLNFCQFQ